MERKIGEIFEYNGEWCQCVESKQDACTDCAFNPINGIGYNCSGSCTYKHVIFKKLEKVGEPTVINEKKVQLLKALEPNTSCYNCCFYHERQCLIPKVKHESNAFYLEIKQNKENMEENNNAKHSNSEKIGKNLKPFDLQKAREGKPVCTRDGRKARIICFDKVDKRPIVGLISDDEGEFIYEYLADGKCYNGKDDSYDLMMLPEKKEGWVNVYKDSVYDTKDEALIGRSESRGYIDTIKINWEE